MGCAVRSLFVTFALLPVLACAETPSGGEQPEAAVIAPLAVRSLLLDVRALPDGRLIAVGERGHVLVSADGGVSWRQSPAPARATLTSVYFADARQGWAVGHDEVILRTLDGGATWFVAHWAPEHEQPLLGVRFDAAGHGLAVGAYSTVYRSDDAGASWQSVPFSAEPLPGTGRPSGPKVPGGAGGAKGEDMRADAWTVQPHLTSITADARGRLYVTAEAGHLYRSDDAGKSWKAIATGTEALLAGATRLADGTIVIAGLEGVVLVSQDGGHSFRVHDEADRKGFDSVAPVPGGVVLCGEAGVRRLTLADLAPRS